VGVGLVQDFREIFKSFVVQTEFFEDFEDFKLQRIF
jgi:hypothetical protein